MTDVESSELWAIEQVGFIAASLEQQRPDMAHERLLRERTRIRAQAFREAAEWCAQKVSEAEKASRAQRPE